MATSVAARSKILNLTKHLLKIFWSRLILGEWWPLYILWLTVQYRDVMKRGVERGQVGATKSYMEQLPRIKEGCRSGQLLDFAPFIKFSPDAMLKFTGSSIFL